jgi:hypothetical protein
VFGDTIKWTTCSYKAVYCYLGTDISEAYLASFYPGNEVAKFLQNVDALFTRLYGITPHKTTFFEFISCNLCLRNSYLTPDPQ